MKKWETPMLVDLAVSGTEVVSDYITTCNWDGAVNLGLGNEEYTDPNNKPAQHPDWVGVKCTVDGIQKTIVTIMEIRMEFYHKQEIVLN